MDRKLFRNPLRHIHSAELDGYAAKKVVLMIGTNNLELNMDMEIVAGLQFLLRQIKVRQPAAQMKVMGILPRRNQEARITALNKKIASLAKSTGAIYADAGRPLLLPNGKVNETLFSDGLHPNAKGYEKIAGIIAR